MKKKILYLLLILLLIPVSVFAEEDAQLVDRLDEVLGGEHKLVVADKTLKEKYLSNMVQEDDPVSDQDGYSAFVRGYINNLPEVKEFLKEYAEEHPVISVYCRSYTNCGIRIDYDSDARGEMSAEEFEQLVQEGYEYPGAYYTHYDIETEFVDEVDEDGYNEIISYFYDEHMGQIPSKSFYLYDLAYINQLYNLSKGKDNIVNNTLYNENLAKAFPEINDIKNGNEDIKVSYSGVSSAGSSQKNVSTEFNYYYTIYYNDVAYLISNFTFKNAPVIFVEDTTLDDALISVAKNRIEEYINDCDLKVEIDDITATFEQEDLNDTYAELDAYLEAIGSEERHNEQTRIYSLKIGQTHSPNNLYIIRAPKESIKMLELKAIEKTTGVRFTSTASIPMDSVFQVNDVTDAYKALNEKVEKAYDINLFSETSETFVKSVAGGMKIYIPVDDSFTGIDKILAYLDDDGTVKEKFTFEIESINGKKYVSFTTTHLSVYGLVDDAVDEVNPATVDNIQAYLMILTISVVSFGTICVFKNKLVK